MYVTRTNSCPIHTAKVSSFQQNAGWVTADTDLLKRVPVEILLNLFSNYFHTIQLGFLKFLSGIVFLHYYKDALQGFSFYRPIHFDQSPDSLNQLKNRQEPLNSISGCEFKLKLFRHRNIVKFIKVFLLQFFL